MPDDNEKAIEAALHEDDEAEAQEKDDGLTPEQRQVILEEAIAEEEFIADQEDKINPMLFGDEPAVEEKPETPEDNVLDGAYGSGNLELDFSDGPISNEEELRKENVNEDNLNPTPVPADDAMNTGFPDPVDAQASEPAFVEPVDAAPAPAEDAGTTTADSFGDAMMSNDPVNAMPEETPAVEPMAEPVTPVMESAPAMEPVAEPAPVVETPAPAPEAAAPVVPTPIPAGMPLGGTEAPAQTVADLATPPKKKKTGLIIFLVILFVLLGGGAVAGVLLYNAHEAPEKQVSDAIDNLFVTNVFGTVANSVSVASGNVPVWNMSITNDKSFEGKYITASMAFKDEKNFFVKVAGIKDVANKTIEDNNKKEKVIDETSDKMVKDFIDGVFDPIEDKWIKLSTDGLDEKYSCLTETTYKLTSASFREKAKAIYDKAPFISYRKDSVVVERDGVKFYEIEENKENSKKFSEEIAKTDEVKAVSACAEEALQGLVGEFLGGGNEIDFDDDWQTNLDFDDDWDTSFSFDDDEEDVATKKEDEEKDNTVVKLGIKPMSHELTAIEIVTDGGEEDGKTTALMTFGIDQKSSDLDSAKEPKEVAEEIVKNLEKAISGMMDTALEEGCKEMKTDNPSAFKEQFGTVDKCVDVMKEELGLDQKEFDLSDIINQFTSADAIESTNLFKSL